jgi:hypothetical protein
VAKEGVLAIENGGPAGDSDIWQEHFGDDGQGKSNSITNPNPNSISNLNPNPNPNSNPNSNSNSIPNPNSIPNTSLSGYYYNPESGESVWDLPGGDRVQILRLDYYKS